MGRIAALSLTPAAAHRARRGLITQQKDFFTTSGTKRIHPRSNTGTGLARTGTNTGARKKRIRSTLSSVRQLTALQELQESEETVCPGGDSAQPKERLLALSAAL